MCCAMQGMSREDFIAGVARDIQSKIPTPFDLPLLKKEIGIPSPTQVVLIQELERWNNVLAVRVGVGVRACLCWGVFVFMCVLVLGYVFMFGCAPCSVCCAIHDLERHDAGML